MKKIFLMSLLMVTTAGLAFSQTITVLSPANGETVIKGSLYTIKWTLSGKQGTTVKINIFKGSIAQPNFVEQLSAPNNGSLKWTIPNSYIPGNYMLRIKTTDQPPVIGDSKVFIVKDKASNSGNVLQINPQSMNQRTVASAQPQVNRNLLLVSPVIAVSEPKKGEIVIPYASFNIKWKSSGVIQNLVRIDAVFQGTQIQYYIVSNIPNNGVYKWDLSKASWAAGDYRIRVRTMDGKVTGLSEVFTIGKLPVSMSNLSKLQSDFLTLINNYRNSKGINTLVMDSCLNKAAQGHSEWMYSTDIFKHEGWNGSKFWERCSAAGCSCDSENIYQGANDATACFNAWKNSPPHNANMLGSHTKIGIGVCGGNWTAVFQ